MNAIANDVGRRGSASNSERSRLPAAESHTVWPHRFGTMADQMIDRIAPCPWVAAAGGHVLGPPAKQTAPTLYTREERERRDASPWTLVQGVLAPIQFLIFAVSLGLVLRYLTTGEGYALATGSILLKTVALYAIMITGSIWEKEVFGRWLFAHAFFWEDVFSILVLALQTTYLFALFTGWGSPRDQMLIAVAAYAAYAVNATQFLLKLRAARLQGVGAAAHGAAAA